MNKFLFLTLLVLPQAYGAVLSHVTDDYKYQDAPEYQVILSQLKTLGDFSAKTSPAPSPDKTMSRGAQVVAEAKAKNKAFIAQQNRENKVLEASNDNLSEMDRLKLEDKKTREGWKKEIIETRKQWQREQDIFLGKIKVYKENTFVMPIKNETIIEAKFLPQLPEVHMVNAAFQVPIRDQFARPTCSAFAGVRAIEVLLAQNKLNHDLSEQYFYWASKPDCHQSPCTQKGSWVNNAYRFSQKHKEIDIPLENNCSYQTKGMDLNETQIPLPSNCHQGTVKVVSFEDVRTLVNVIEKLKQNIPVIMAAKLTENFYKNQGLVSLGEADKKLGVGLDQHALGHAFLAVGLMELPEKIKTQEGSFCIVIANSWGKGWGAGGYSCLTEKWLTKYRQPAPFAAVTHISVR
ncbi:MAG: C1 family peptidase [Bdellovibrionales bacterium]|nr:C1 family peptidase [Bdellovibrionales bacterium]